MTHGRSIEVAGIGHNAPIPLGARVGALLCSSGIAGKDPATGKLSEDPARQVAQAFANLDAFLAAGGATLAHLAKLTLYASDPAQVRDAVNAEWLARFPDPQDRPARHLLTYALQHGMVVQLEALAFIPPDNEPSRD